MARFIFRLFGFQIGSRFGALMAVLGVCGVVGCSSPDLSGLFSAPAGAASGSGGDSSADYRSNGGAESSISEAGAAGELAGAPPSGDEAGGVAGKEVRSNSVGGAIAGASSLANSGGQAEAGGSATGGSATAGSATADSATAGSATAGSATAGSATAGSATAGANAAGTAGDVSVSGATASAGSGGTSGSNGVAGSAGSGGDSAGSAGSAGSDLVLYYPFDEATGSTAVDASNFPGGPRNATLATTGAGSVLFYDTRAIGTHSVACVAAGSNGGYLNLPSITALAPQAITLAAWVYVTSSTTWQRVFDFGNGTTQYMFLTTQEGDETIGGVRFAITDSGLAGEQRINSTKTLSINTWHHVAVVLGAGATYSGTVYVDGKAVATKDSMTLHPSDLGATTSSNYLCRSRYTTDPYLTGLIDDFRVYRRALSAPEMAALFALR